MQYVSKASAIRHWMQLSYSDPDLERRLFADLGFHLSSSNNSKDFVFQRGRQLILRRASPLRETIMKILLILNPSTNNQQNQSTTHLRIAAAENKTSEVRRLLDLRPDINLSSDDLGIALIDACRAGHEEIVRLLLDAGADVNHADNDDGSALMAASKNGRRSVMRILLEAGARVEMVHAYGNILSQVLNDVWMRNYGGSRT